MTGLNWLLMALLAGVAAAEPAPLPGPDQAGDQGRRAQRESTQVADVAKRYGVGERDVRSLRSRGMGWGEVERALEVSVRGRRPLSEVTELRESGMSWEEVAEHYGMKPASMVAAEREEGLRDAVRRIEKAPAAARKAKRGKGKEPGAAPRGQDPYEGRVEQPGEQGLLRNKP